MEYFAPSLGGTILVEIFVITDCLRKHSQRDEEMPRKHSQTPPEERTSQAYSLAAFQVRLVDHGHRHGMETLHLMGKRGGFQIPAA